MSALPYRASDDGDAVALGLVDEEQRPVDDAGHVISYLRAAVMARNFRQHLEDLDQMDAWLRDNREDSLRHALKDFTKRMQRRLREVTR